MQGMLEETLTKNLHLQQDLESMSQVIIIIIVAILVLVINIMIAIIAIPISSPLSTGQEKQNFYLLTLGVASEIGG